MISLLVSLAAFPAQSSPTLLPDVVLTDMQNRPVRLRSFIGKKLIVFNWASW